MYGHKKVAGYHTNAFRKYDIIFVSSIQPQKLVRLVFGYRATSATLKQLYRYKLFPLIAPAFVLNGEMYLPVAENRDFIRVSGSCVMNTRTMIS